MKIVTVSPSDINYLFDRCPRCWRRKLDKVQKPKDQLPQVFRKIDGGMKEAYDVETLRELGINARRVVPIESVRSRPIAFPRQGLELVISGKLDKAAELEDGTLAIVEFKTSEFNDWKVEGFKRQVHAYETALRLPAKAEPREVSEIHLIFFQPYATNSFRTKLIEGGRIVGSLLGEIKHQQIEIDRAGFDRFLEKMATVAASPTLPDPGKNCDFCKCIEVATTYDRRIA